MNFVSNGDVTIAVIPECKATSVMNWAVENNFSSDIIGQTIYAPYRDTYGRIIRGIGADLHELMYDAGVVNLNSETWDSVRDKAMSFIERWIETATLPIEKKFCHSLYYTSYLADTPLDNIQFVDVSDFDTFHLYLNEKHNLTVKPFQELPPEFYNHTVPYWEIDRLYGSNTRLTGLINDYCASESILQTIRIK